jgi:4-amino-4-deoxy-L-arabinose transferase-like glycosyltransferase
MPAAKAGRRLPAWPLALGALLAGAVALRLWGVRHGLPYVFNADENAHFVPRAIGMFGHSLNPEYFINPPAFTYLLHGAFWMRWGGREAVGDAFAADPTAAFTIARVLAALLGVAAAGLLVWAGARLFDRRVGVVAGALLAVAFLPVHYGHFALNDVPALAPLCLSLVGVAGVHRRGRLRDYALAGAALGVACATKYTAGIVLLCLLAAAVTRGWVRPVESGRLKGSDPPPRRPGRGLAVAGLLAAAGFLVANPYALLDWEMFREGLQKQSEASGDGGGKLGLVGENGILYYLGTTTWGLGWLPAVVAAGGAVALAARRWRLALVLVPAPVVFVLFMGAQDRFFARWLLPVYPLLCLLAAWAAVEAAGWLAGRVRPTWRRAAWPAAAAGALLCAQGLAFSLHNDLVLSRADTRELARAWMVSTIAAGERVVIEPIAPHQWATDPSGPSRATGTGARWIKWPTSRSGRAVVKLEDYERTLRPELVGRYAGAGYCWVVTGSTQYGRALAEPDEVPEAIAYYDALRRRGRPVFRVSPLAGGEPVERFSFDFSFNAYPLDYERPGPEIVIYRLSGGVC